MGLVVIGTAVNAGAIVLGGTAGLLWGREPSARWQGWLRSLMGVGALWLGFRAAWLGVHGSVGRVGLQVGAALLSLMLGNLVGKACGLQRQVNRLGRYAGDHYRQAQAGGRTTFGDGLVTSAILFCVGPLAVLGSLQDGLLGDPRTLILKGAMDGLATLAFVRVLGGGSLVAALPVLAYQGTLTLLARSLAMATSQPAVLDGIGVVAGLLVAMSALIIFEVRKVPLWDYLPALALAPLVRWWVG